MKHNIDRDLIRVRHMIDAINEALVFTKNCSRASLDANRMLTLALLKELELIGEAAAKITEPFKRQHAEVPWTIVIAMRNRLVHGYFDVDLDIVWRTIEQDLPALQKKLVTILDQRSAETTK